MRQYRLIIIAVVLLALALQAVLVVSSRGTLSLAVSAESEIKEGIEVYISSRRFDGVSTAPATIKLRPGTYSVYATAPGTGGYHQTVSIIGRRETRVEILLRLVTEEDQEQIELTPSAKEAASNRLLELFPYRGDGFTIQANLGRNSEGHIYIKSLDIFLYPSLASNESESLKQAEIEFLTAEAAAWLRQQGVAESVPTTVHRGS